MANLARMLLSCLESLGLIAVVFFLSPISALGASAEEIYAGLAKMPKNQRQQVVVEKAQKEGKLLVYGSTEESQAKAIINGFNKHYPSIKVDYFRAVSSTIVSKAMLEVNAGRWTWDLLSIGPGYQDVKQGNAAAKHYGLIAEEIYPKQFIGGDWFGFEILPLVIAYNKTLVKPGDVPKSYRDPLGAEVERQGCYGRQSRQHRHRHDQKMG